jgi:sulfatase maturation enzyme AslB (radical SAM superfamily)
MYVHTDGTLHVCCTAVDGEVRRQDGRPFHIEDGASEAEIVNSHSMRNMKAQMMRGEWPDACARCQRDESLGAMSRRQHELRRFGRQFAAMASATDGDGTSQPATSFFDYRLGNTCNLKCRMCHPLFSSLWINEYHLVQGHPLEPSEKQKYLGLTWHRDERVFHPLLEQLQYVEHLHFAGGEPLIIPQTMALLRRIVDAGEAGHIALNFNTNLTKIPGELRTLWPQFKQVHVYCSIDGYGRLNEYIRSPSSWQELDANLHHLDEAFAEYGLSEVAISCTVQAYNVLRLGELFDYLATAFKNIRPVPALPLLDYPSFFDIRILTDSLKRLAIERLENARTVHSSGAWKPYPVMVRTVDGIIQALNQEIEGVQGARALFAQVTQRLDRQRAENLLDVVPEMAPMLAPITSLGSRAAPQSPTPRSMTSHLPRWLRWRARPAGTSRSPGG